ncbi:hypothetical protein ALC53_08518 [Atta colombica]|uniref:Uncharacterized protein n=1 Tax=Atta colombica TaxID=520822 RepID=A0A195BAC5_9HYME|nr:hypothetical protein ALC53_08518 [Atta colombica]
MANDSCCDRCQDASLPRAITQWPPLFLRGYHAPIAESADPREIMDCHDALSITSPRTSTDTPSYPIKRTRRANHSSTVNPPSPRVNPARARLGRNQYPLNEMRQRCTILLAVVHRRASLKNLVTIRIRYGKKEKKDESFEDCERQKITRPIFSYRTYAKSLSYLSGCIEFTSQVERIQLYWNLALVTRNASLERAISPTAITLTCIIGICVGDAASQYTMTDKTSYNQPRNDCFKSCETTVDGFPHSREFTSPALNRVLYKPSRKSQQKTSQSDCVIHGDSREPDLLVGLSMLLREMSINVLILISSHISISLRQTELVPLPVYALQDINITRPEHSIESVS